MIEASRTLALPSLTPALVRRHRPLMLAPPANAITLPADTAGEPKPAWSDWKQDVRFFLGCYAAGLVFFFIMLS
jgi:hypothetical protein